MSQESPHTPPAPRAPRWRFGPVVLDGSTHELTVGGSLVRLEPKPLELLLHLLRHPGEVVTKEELHEHVWPGRILSESVLTKTMAKLRQALGDEEQALIKTVHGYGYRVVVPVMLETTTASAPAVVGNLRAGDAIPRRPQWRLERSLGAGAYGEVWLGSHPRTRENRVFKFSHDASGLNALKRELTLYRLQQKVAGEERRDLVKLIDCNFEEPPYFLEMEHAQGGSLVDWVTAQGGFEKVPMSTRLSLLAQAAQSLAAAHACGVLHKDLKPSNILVDYDRQGRPLAKLGDFGSARLLDLERLALLEITRLGFTGTAGDSAEGTALYLAPELLAGQQPTVQSDLYALGVALYQLAVGDFKRPLAAGWEEDIPDVLLREDIAHAAASQTARRCRDAAQFAERLQNHEARRAALDQAAEEARTQARLGAEAAELRQALAISQGRRRWQRGVLAVLVGGLMLAAALFWQTRQALQKTETARAETQAVLDFVNDRMLSAGDPLAQGGVAVTMESVIEAAGLELDQQHGLPAAATARLGDSLGNGLYGLGPNHDATNELRMGYGETLRELSALGEAMQVFVEVAESTRHLPEPRRTQWQQRSLHGQGYVAHTQGNYELAARHLQSVLSSLEQSPGNNRHSRGYAHWDLAEALIELNQFGEAQAHWQQAMTHFRERVNTRNLLIEWAGATGITLHLARGEADKALAAADASLSRNALMLTAMQQEMKARLPTYQRGLALLQLGRAAEAVQVLADNHALRLSALGEAHLHTLNTGHALAMAHLAAGETAASLALSEQLIATASRVLPASHPRSLAIRRTLSDGWMADGQAEKARKSLAALLPLAGQQLQASHRLRAELLASLARAQALAGQPAEAAATLEQALTAFRSGLGEKHPRTQAVQAAATRPQSLPLASY